MTKHVAWLGMAAFLASGAAPVDESTRPGAATITAKDMLRHIEILASDALEGRGPGTTGEDRTVTYLTEQFSAAGLKPGNPDGTFVQQVPLVGFRGKVRGAIQAGGTKIELTKPEAWMAVSRRLVPESKVEGSAVVFVGYGVVAPEFDRDDYKDVDVRGKTLVMLVGDPPIPDKNDPDQLDPARFGGKAMTYYGRWTYKFEIAAEKGAAAVLLVHEEKEAGYPYQVVVGSWGRENFDIPSEDRNQGRAAVEAWIALDTAKRLCKAAGEDFDDLKKKAVADDFQPVALDANADFEARNTMRNIKSRNVLARLEGSDATLKGEMVVYTAHWDHLGKDETLPGDQIYNGAADNASGVAALIEIAEAFARTPARPRRSLLFLAVTAEEKGLLGAKYYAAHPLYPLEKTLADINMDVTNLWGRTRDVINVGKGQTTLDEILAECASAHGRVVEPDAEPEKGMSYRSDHFEFAKRGVPALNVKGGMNYLGKPAGFGKHKRDEYTRNDYHKVSDEVKSDWDLAGAVEDARLLFEVGYRIAQANVYPEWKPGTEFRARREAMLKRPAK